MPILILDYFYKTYELRILRLDQIIEKFHIQEKDSEKRESQLEFENICERIYRRYKNLKLQQYNDLEMAMTGSFY